MSRGRISFGRDRFMTTDNEIAGARQPVDGFLFLQKIQVCNEEVYYTRAHVLSEIPR